MNHFSRTKIICTIGPAVNSYEKIKELINAGMNVARVNFSHGCHSEHLKTINLLKKARSELKIPLSIMLDTKGPEIRISKVYEDKIELKPKQKLKLVKKFSGAIDEIEVFPIDVFKNVEKGQVILFDDGYIISKVLEKKSDHILIEIENEGFLKTKKGVNIPNYEIDLPAITEIDEKDLIFGCDQGVDLVAASFIRSAEHVMEIKKFLAKHKGSDIMVIAKIENQQGITSFNTILEVADGIMVARGDLGVEIDLSLVPKYQKMMIRKCYQAGKPVITATQMLESMIQYPRPTRAEASDVANAIYDSTSAVMLSGETGIGKYPIQTVKQMKKIVKEAENDFDYRSFFHHIKENEESDASFCVAISAVNSAYQAKAKAIFVYTSSGYTARLISRMRPAKPIIALTSSEKTYNQMATMWGVIPVLSKNVKDQKASFDALCKFAKENNIVSFGDIVIVTAGVHFGKKGSTNMMMIESIGNILVRGIKGFGDTVKGEIAIIYGKEDLQKQDISKKILVISHIDESIIPLLDKALGVVLQNNPADHESERILSDIFKKNNISYITRANNAMTMLSDGDEVLLDPHKKMVYKD
jgi:pyruvate kinase